MSAPCPGWIGFEVPCRFPAWESSLAEAAPEPRTQEKMQGRCRQVQRLIPPDPTYNKTWRVLCLGLSTIPESLKILVFPLRSKENKPQKEYDYN